MRICRVCIENYRNLKSVDVTLGNIVTLIGENNSGKTNFLRALTLPLASDDLGINKHLSWYDINRDAKSEYYKFIRENKQAIIDGTITVEQFMPFIPTVSVSIFLQPKETEHYNVNDILCCTEEKAWVGGITYRFYIKNPADLLARVKSVLTIEFDESKIEMSLLPVEFYSFSINVPGKESKIPYETLSKFRAVVLPAERDTFAANADKLGSKALSEILRMHMSADSQTKIEKKYQEFFDAVREEGRLDEILNWQDYSDIPNAQGFFKEITILPNMPQMSSILGSIRLGYSDDNMFAQGLGHRNLVLMAVILNSYINKERSISYRLLTVEEPEAHLCNSNVLLMISLFNVFSHKNNYTQIVYSTHNAEFVNKLGLDKVIVFHAGKAYNLGKELSDIEKDYLSANPNTDIFKLLYSKKLILVEGITEELLIKAYLQMRTDLNEIKVLSFHKGFTKIVEIWKKINLGTKNKLGIVRDYDNQPNAQSEHEAKGDKQVIVRTTKGYTLETDITTANYELLKSCYGEDYGWASLTAAQIQADWRDNKKADVMLRICHDLIDGKLDSFVMPPHIQQIIDFMHEVSHEG